MRYAPNLEPARDDWRDRARCKGMDQRVFFGRDGENTRRTGPSKQEREAIAVCNSGCPVKDECLEHALAVPERFGVWGATTGEQRRLILKGKVS